MITPEQRDIRKIIKIFNLHKMYRCWLTDEAEDMAKEILQILNANTGPEDEACYPGSGGGASGYGWAPEPNLVVVKENVRQVPLVVGAGAGGNTEPEEIITATNGKCDVTLTAHTEPENEWKRFPKGMPSSMEDIVMEYPDTEPEDEPKCVHMILPSGKCMKCGEFVRKLQQEDK